MNRFIAPSLIIAGAFGSRRAIDLRAAAGPAFDRMPWCHRILLENVLRQDDAQAAEAGRDAFVAWLGTGRSEVEIPFAPLRILMHDTTCGPALTDIAAMRDVLAEAGGDPALLNPSVPVATSTDHSWQSTCRPCAAPPRSTWRARWSATPNATAS